MREQLAIRVDSLDALIEARAAQALAEIHAMAHEAIEFINRSTGQHIRRNRERFSQRIAGLIADDSIVTKKIDNAAIH